MPLDSHALVAIVSVVVAAVLLLWLQRALRTRRLRRRFRHARDGEDRARSYLVKHGFAVLQEQVTRTPVMWVDNARNEFTVRADYLVRKRGRRAVVEVKTGTTAPDPTASATRRQLLEYARCYDVDDIYLFDAERNALVAVRFDTRESGRSPVRAMLWFATGFAAACAVLAWVLRGGG
jgi:Holliday junction resolvase-like predicted endonuclease